MLWNQLPELVNFFFRVPVCAARSLKRHRPSMVHAIAAVRALKSSPSATGRRERERELRERGLKSAPKRCSQAPVFSARLGRRNSVAEGTYEFRGARKEWAPRCWKHGMFHVDKTNRNYNDSVKFCASQGMAIASIHSQRGPSLSALRVKTDSTCKIALALPRPTATVALQRHYWSDQLV